MKQVNNQVKDTEMSLLIQAKENLKIIKQLDEFLSRFDDGELYVEESNGQILTWDNDKIKTSSSSQSSGFGLRAVQGELVGYAHGSNFTEKSIEKAMDIVGLIGSSQNSFSEEIYEKHDLYGQKNALEDISVSVQILLLQEINDYIRQKDEYVEKVNLSLICSHQSIGIYRPLNGWVYDERPLIRLNISLVMKKGDRRESGSDGFGARQHFSEIITEESWKAGADRALLMAALNLEAVEAPAGEMSVVLGSGWPGVLLHEAVGHGLEGDFNRKGSSVFSSMMGQKVAAKGVTVVDQGNIPSLRGSLNMDDEGTPTQKTTLIEDGILVGYMQDRQNARLMGKKSTGNGRRESFAHMPMVRMTNTFMEAGEQDPEEIIASLEKGIYAESFGGGQVDITSGQFVFSCTQAWLIEKGKKIAPIKGATLIGSGAESLKHISMIGNDFSLDRGVGTCGKAGQGVPVGVGQPTIRIDQMTVGGQSV